jgi:hypothetical protein
VAFFVAVFLAVAFLAVAFSGAVFFVAPVPFFFGGVGCSVLFSSAVFFGSEPLDGGRGVTGGASWAR